MMQCSLWRGGRKGEGILSIMTRMNEKDEMSIISADLALERSISVREIRQWLAVMMQGRVASQQPLLRVRTLAGPQLTR